MSRFNTSTNHPLIPNANEYMYEKQFISIHSEDRNVLKFPLASDFEIELPQDYCNVQGVKLDTWSFPSNYYVFSQLQNNISLVFEITNPYNPSDFMVNDPLLVAMCDAMWAYKGKQYIATIEEGFYNPFQIATELTNRMNLAVTNVIVDYIQNTLNDAALLEQFNKTGYDQFVVAYNEVGQKLWFGNKSSEFIVSNNSQVYVTNTLAEATCTRQHYPDFSNWGLPAYLGFSRQVATTTTSSGGVYPRFYYGDSNMPGDNGFWLIPDTQYLGVNSSIPVYYLEAPFRVNLMGQSYFYIEIEGMNTIDETIPFSVNRFTSTTNGTTGVVKSAFAKIAVTTTPMSQWYDNYSLPVKIYNPPAERIRKLKIKVRYHNGALVDFGTTDFSIMLEFMLLRPQNKREYSAFTPESYS
jgi:hypothetical protein